MLIVAIVLNSCQKRQSFYEPGGYNVKLIPSVLARQIAQRITVDFLQKKDRSTEALRITGATTGIPNRIIGDSLLVPDDHGNTALYIYNYTNDSGFVVISADARHEPICAFVETGKFEEDTVPSMLIEWFDATVENIEMVRNSTYDNTERANYAWYDLLLQTDLISLNEVLRPKPVDPPIDCEEGWVITTRGPLLSTAWGQRCTYNESCPSKGCTNPCYTNDKSPTGCVATSMSQVLRYWAHPSSFNYDYASMPNTFGNSEVQRMMYDAGRNVDMDYGCSASGAPGYKIDDALVSAFKFSSASGPSFLNQNNYNTGSYITVKSNLDNSWPVILGGFAKRKNVFLGIIHKVTDGHSWVCDGYWSSQNRCYGYLRFHMNWGWHEIGVGNDFNGWYAFNLWNPGNRNYQYAQHYIYNIHP